MSITLIFNIVLFFLFLLFLIKKLQGDFRMFYLLLLFYIQGFNTMTSLVYIENGIYINEQGRESSFAGAVFFYLMFFILTILLCEKTIVYLDKQINIKSFNLKVGSSVIGLKLLLSMVIFVLFLLYLNVYLSPSPFFDKGVTRFNYWDNSKLKFLNTIFGNTSIFIPFSLGLIHRRYKKVTITLLILYFINMVLIGQKFSPIVSGLYAFFFPIVLTSHKRITIPLVKFINYKVLLVLFCLFGFVYYKYSLLNPFKHLGVDTPFQAIIYRAFGLQAHLFWGCVQDFIITGKPVSWNMFDLNYGMHHLMRYFYPGDEDQLNRAIAAGYSFTNAYPAVLIYIFPVYVAYIIHVILMVFVLSPLIWFLKFLIKGNNVIFSVIAFQLFSWVVYAFKMGYFYKLSFPITFVFLLSFLFYLIHKSKISK